MDRVDIRLDVPPVDLVALTGNGSRPESSAAVAERVLAARERAAFRWREAGYVCNAEASSSEIRELGCAPGAGMALIDRAVRVGNLSARGYDRVLRLALTAADLADRSLPDESDIARALAFRSGVAA